MCSYDGELFNLDFSVHVLFPSYRDSDLYLPLYRPANLYAFCVAGTHFDLKVRRYDLSL